MYSFLPFSFGLQHNHPSFGEQIGPVQAYRSQADPLEPAIFYAQAVGRLTIAGLLPVPKMKNFGS
jgi:hypothetical protein